MTQRSVTLFSDQSPVSRCVTLFHDIVTIVTNLVTCGQLLRLLGRGKSQAQSCLNFKFGQKTVLIINSRIKCGRWDTWRPSIPGLRRVKYSLVFVCPGVLDISSEPWPAPPTLLVVSVKMAHNKLINDNPRPQI